MNRRTFLRSIATVCGAAVVCPGELVKSPIEFRLNQAQKDIIIANARQQGCTNSTRNWIKYHNSYILNNKPMPFLVNKLEKEFWNTKFKSPLMKGINETT